MNQAYRRELDFWIILSGFLGIPYPELQERINETEFAAYYDCYLRNPTVFRDDLMHAKIYALILAGLDRNGRYKDKTLDDHLIHFKIDPEERQLKLQRKMETLFAAFGPPPEEISSGAPQEPNPEGEPKNQ